MKTAKLTTIILLLLVNNLSAQINVTNTGILQISSASDTLFITNDLSNTSAASLVNNGNIYLKGNLANNQQNMLAGTGTLLMNGSSAQTISGSKSFNTNNLTINNSTGVTLSDTVSLSGVLTVTSGAFNMGSQNFIFRSTAVNTARVAPVLGSITNAGNVTVERYITSLNNRAYRLLGPSVTTSSNIRANWQENTNNTNAYANNDPFPTYGTQITGTGASSNGFDVSITNQSSLYNYNQATAGWQAVTNTNINTLNALTGYLLYIRGNRSINLSATGTLPSSNTTLRATGTLLTGTQTFSSLTSNGLFSLVTNPYASPIDWNLIYTGSAATNFENYYTFWDPNVGTRGGYVTVTNGNIVSDVYSVATKEIQSGQAFFVKTKAGINSPSLSITENNKSTANNISVFSPVGNRQQLSAGLFFTQSDGTRKNADGIIAIFDNSYSSSVDENDAEEIANWDENIAIAREGKNLSIETRPEINYLDTIGFFINHLKQQSYNLEIISSINNTGLTGYLQDNFLNTDTQINLTDTSSINFDVTADPLSSATNRFRLVFALANPLPVTLTTVKAYQQGEGIKVEWKVENELNVKNYEVERSYDGNNFTRINSITATGNSSYNIFDSHPFDGNNFYRIKSIDVDGRSKYSSVVKVNISGKRSLITIYPNPVQNNILSLSMENMPKGVYNLKVINDLGQVLLKKSISHNEGNGTEIIMLDKNVIAGTYLLEIIKPDNTIVTNKMTVR